MTMSERGQMMLMERNAPNLPWNQWAPEKLGPCVMQFLRDNDIYYRRWAQKWFENFQFYYGNQSLRWSRRYDFATDYDYMRQSSPSMYQRSQTNITRTAYEALCSEMFGTMPDWDVDTMSDSSVMGKRMKHIVQSILDAYMERLMMEKEFGVASASFCLYGNYASKTDWLDSAGTVMDIPLFENGPDPITGTFMAPNSLSQGLIEVPADIPDSQGKPQTENVWRPRIGPDGKPMVKKIFTGDARTRVLTPFEYRRPIGSYGSHKDKYFQELRILDYDEYLDEYGKLGGIQKSFYDIRPVFADPQVYNFAVNHFFRMQLTTPPVFSEALRRQSVMFKSQLMRGKVFVVEHFDRPHPWKWPLGRRLVITNGICTHITVPNYRTTKLDGWHPYVEGQWAAVPPNSIASGPINDVVSKNKELNVADSLIATAMRRNMGSQLLFKTGAGFDPEKFTGEPGAMMEVNDPFAARWLHDDTPIAAAIPALRQNFKDDAYDTSGAGDSLRGQRSIGVSSGYQAKQYEEREEKRLTLAKTNFEHSISGWGEKIFTCVRTNCIKLDQAMIGFLKRSSAGRFDISDVYALLASPADFGTDIKVKKSSMAVTSKASQQATLQELAKGPAGQRIANDARVMDEYLKFFDVETFRDQSATHRDRAGKENEVFSDMLNLGALSSGVMKPVVIFQDDDAIHMAEHDLWYLQHFEEIRQNDGLHSQFLVHQEMHRLQQEEKAGRVAPGTSLNTAQAFVQARSTPLPNYAEVQQQNGMLRQMQQQQAQGAPQQPQAPTQPAAPGSGGPPQIDPNAPAANTPTGANPNTSGASQ